MSNLPKQWPHQRAEFEKNSDRDKLMLLWAPRLGKSRAALDFLLKKSPKRALVTAPLVVCPQWVELLQKTGISAYSGHSRTTVQIAAWLKAGGGGVIVLNDDKLAKLVGQLLRWAPDLYIGDESHRFRTASSKRSKAMRKIAWQAKYVRLLTGTPTPNNVGNLWGQMTAIDRDTWGSSYTRFSQKHLICDPVWRSKVLGVQHPKQIRDMINQSASILTRGEVFGEDQYQVVIRNVSLPPKAEKLYRELVKKWVTEDAMSTGEVIDVTHTLKRIVRLQQLTSGFIPDESGVVHEVHSAKFDMLFADLEEIIESGEKVVVFHQFTREGESIYERAKREFPGIGVYRIYGGSTGVERASSIQDFETMPGSAIFVIQTRSGGIGISLASATHAAFVSQSFSFDDEQQARDRIYKPGQSKCVTYYRVSRTVDDYIASILESKLNIHDAVTRDKIESIAGGCTFDKKGLI